jgi:SAM-dependent methyltransferase
MSQGNASANHEYVLRTALTLSPASRPSILDLGCGQGYFVESSRNAGADSWGADTYAGVWEGWQGQVPTSAIPYIRQIEAGRLPYDNDRFDVVVSNQVFEHVSGAELRQVLEEISRVLKPGGFLLALFPAADVWFEGHLGVYAPHRLQKWPRLQWGYLALCHVLGFGYDRIASAKDWATREQAFLNGDVFHHSPSDFHQLVLSVFRSEPSFHEVSYMRFRLGRIGRFVPASLLRFVCRKRAGIVLSIAKAPLTRASASMPTTQR